MLPSSWLKGSDCDAPHAALCAAGFSIRWLQRAIARVGLRGHLFAMILTAARHLAVSAAAFDRGLRFNAPPWRRSARL